MKIEGLAVTLIRTLTTRGAPAHQRTLFKREEAICTFEHALYFAIIVPLVAFLPAPLAYGIACTRGNWRSRLDKRMSRQVRSSLEDILGDQLSQAEQDEAVLDFFRLRSCEAVDKRRLVGKGRQLARLVEIRGLEHVEAALSAGKGAILCGAHFGSFTSCAPLIGSYGFPITVVGRWANALRPRRSAIERFFWQLLYQKPLAHHLHYPNIEPQVGKFGVAVQISKILRQNELISIALDPPVLAADRERGISMEFLNGKALLLPGAITIAKLMEAPVLMIFLRRSADMQHQILEISAPVSLEGDIVEAFGRCLSWIDAAIRRNPAHWIYWGSPALTELGLLSSGEKKIAV